MNWSVFQVDIKLNVTQQYTRPLSYMFIVEGFYNVLERYQATDIQWKHTCSVKGMMQQVLHAHQGDVIIPYLE